MLRLARWFALALTGLASACVFVQQPLGTEPANLEPAEWDGPWVAAAGGVARFTVVDSDVLRISPIQGREELAAIGDLRLRRWKDWYIPQFGEAPRHTVLMAILRDGNSAFLCDFSSDRIADLVTDGWLPGKAEIDPHGKFPATVTLDALNEEHYRILFSLDAGSVVCSRDGLFVRLPSELDACVRQVLESPPR